MSRHTPAQQPLLRVDTARNGLFRHVLVAGTDRVDDTIWRHRARTGQHVGTCKQPGCGAPMLAGPDPPDYTGAVTTYSAQCTSPVCGHIAVGLGPRPRTKKSRRR